MLEALRQLPPETIIGHNDAPVAVRDVAELCMVPLPRGGRAPIGHVGVSPRPNGGYWVTVLSPVMGFDEVPNIYLVTDAASPATPILEALIKDAHQPELQVADLVAQEVQPANGYFRLSDGDIVHLDRLVIGRTYDGCLEGDPRGFSLHILRDIEQRAASLLGREPVHVLPPETIPLPDYLFVGSFERSEDSQPDGPMVSSSLNLAWFVEALDQPLGDVIQAAVAKVDWEKHADRYEWEP